MCGSTASRRARAATTSTAAATRNSSPSDAPSTSDRRQPNADATSSAIYTNILRICHGRNFWRLEERGRMGHHALKHIYNRKLKKPTQ